MPVSGGGGVFLLVFGLPDEWNACSHTCPVCELPLDRSVDVLSDDFPVGAWRVPLEQGGENSLANRIVVHRRCA